MASEEHYVLGRAYREGSLVCGRMQVKVGREVGPRRAPQKRRYVAARFLDRLHPQLRAELTELAHGGGAAARLAADRMQPIVVVIDDPSHGRERIVARIEPPHVLGGFLGNVEFGLRELAE